jgi:hypothetical protein
MRAPEGTLISFATQPGNIAQDGAGGNSLYTKSLVEAMRKPGLDVFKTFNEVGLTVAGATHGAQQPWLSFSPLKGDFYFAGANAASSEPPAFPSFTPDFSSLTSEPITLWGQRGEWGVYVASSGGKKICFTVALPTSSESIPPNANASRDPPYLMITSRPADKVANEVSILIGYPFKPNSEATVQVGSKSFAFYTQKNVAWLKNLSEEIQLLNALRNGLSAVVKGVSAKGVRSTDTYRLIELWQALDLSALACR